MKTHPTLSLLLISSAFLTTSYAPSASVDSGIADAATIRTLDKQWSAAAARKDLTATIAFYADDAVLLPPNAPIAIDRKSIRDSWAALLGQATTVSWKVSKAEVAKSSELGYLYGTYELSINDSKGGPPFSDTGKLVEIWKKQADGKWRCIVDIYNSDLPIPVATDTKK